MTPAMSREISGSPAWAGIDRGGGFAAVLYGRFPRVGGDRPHAAALVIGEGEVPPRGRG